MPSPAEIVYELAKLKRSVSEMIWESVKEDRRQQKAREQAEALEQDLSWWL